MSKRRGLSAGLIWVCLLAVLAVGGAAFAQGTVPIQIGQNATGTLTTEAPSAQYALTSNGGETVMIQALAISQGFAPNFHVLNPAGIEILTVSNPDAKPILTGNAALNGAGTYTIVVGGENGSTGQFVLSLQAGAPLPPPTALVFNQPLTATVGSQTPIQVYRFDTTSLGATSVRVISQTPNAGALVTLFDESAGKTIASSDGGVVGVIYQLPASGKAYRVEVQAGGSGDTAFTICLGPCGDNSAAGNGNPPATPTLEFVVPPAATPEASAAACSATSNAGGSVNLRSGPGTGYAVLASLPLGQSVPVIAQWTGGGWYEVNANGLIFWVGGSVVSLSGDCTTLPRIAAPTNVPLAPTAAPVRTPEVEPSDTPDRPLPNLTTINIQVSNPGDGTLNIDVTVINAGKAPVDVPYAVKTCLDNTNCDEITGFAEGLQPGETMSFTDGLPFDGSGGSHTVLVTVDSQHEVTESNEGDNDGFASFNN
ncbi:MAG: SH3 domain-containing protein [Chloroflexota bacterium]